MNRNMLNLNTFDPAPMALGERTTRQPAEPVNPRAAFEAFERGDHQVEGEVAPLAKPRDRKFLGPEPDDGEGDTPDIMRRIVVAGEKLNRIPLWRRVRACFLDPGKMPDERDLSTARYVQALERAVRETQPPVTLGMCHTMFVRQTHAGRDVARVMRSFGIDDTRQLGDDQQVLRAFYACLVNIGTSES